MMHPTFLTPNSCSTLRKVRSWVALLMVLLAAPVMAQFTYTFSTGTPGYTNLSGGTNVTTGGNVNNFLDDEEHSDAINLGFTFGYDGVAYTQVKVNSNGFISLETGDVPSGGTGTSSAYSNQNWTTVSTSMRPIICPLWDDLAGGTNNTASVASYATTGSAPNRVFTVEWRNWRWNYNANNAVISFQCKLYETTNVIEFIYRADPLAIVTTGSGYNSGASIGIISGSGSYYRLSNSGGSPTAVLNSGGVNNILTKPATGQLYRFTPSGCSGPSISSTTSNTPICASSTLTLNTVATGTAPLS
ncbi:MAG: hypothetical protein ABI599_13565, partial [Flavobacteriales bacterium]